MNLRVKNQYFFVILVVFFVACSLFGVVGNTQAQLAVDGELSEEEKQKTDGIPDSGLQLSPTKFIWTLKDGTEMSDRINVKNYSDFEQKVHVEVEDFFVGEDGSKPNFFIPDSEHPLNALDVIDWITPPEDFILGPGEAKWVDFNVSVPEGQPTNGYYGSILFKTSGVNENPEESHIGISYRIAALVILAVQGDEPMQKTVEFNEFYPIKDIFYETPITLIAKITNTGNIHFPMFGEITINKFGRKFHITELSPQLIYPGIPRQYTEKIMFDWWDFGKYDAHLSMWSEDKTIKFEEDTSFWVIPWKGMLVVFGCLVGVWIMRALFKKYIHIGEKPRTRKKTKK
jgi:hypothetical protein